MPMTEVNLLTDEKDQWACGRSVNGYMGGFPNGFLSRVQRQLGVDLENNDVLYPFGGLTPQRENWTVNDLRKGEPTGPDDEPLTCDTGYDARDLPDEWTDKYDVVLSDPPYGKDYASELYDLEFATPKSHMSEATRVVKPGGYVLILDQLVYNLDWSHKDHRVERETVIGVTTGPGMRIRALNVFRKPNTLRDYQ